MHIINLGLDSRTLDPNSVVASRNRKYGSILESYIVIVPSREKRMVSLSSNTFVFGTGGIHKSTQLLRMFFLCLRLMRKERTDVITSQDTYFLGLLGFVLSRLFHTGLEVQVLGIEKLSFFRKKLAQFTLQKAHSIRVLSLGLKKRLLSEFGIKEDRMMLVPIYVDVSSLGLGEHVNEDQRKEIELEVRTFRQKYADRFNIVCVNRLVPIKNIPMQLEAIAALKEVFPNILLHVVGEGPLREELAGMVKQLSIQDHVILHGQKFGPQLRPFFSECDCFVLTSDFEGYGMVIIEAATAGACIVMTDVGCAGEVIKDGESGLVVPVNDTRTFTEALRRVLTDTSLCDSLKAGARRSIAELPTFDKVLEKYMASWQQARERSKK